ncbi:MAG: bifunctional proline dehydrogenase/L-glutamate gamma-semialdehyde dehydrogenase, partial [Gammaproteobacteria bacterium]|nr:bifunctional proline dehydrogenase/L-glutamate gamma-semialdehyde dehydrogenase [Gammaproteobacteria bacterium]
NRLSTYPRGTVLCCGPDFETLKQQVKIAQAAGCSTLAFGPGGDSETKIPPEFLTELTGFHAVAFQGDTETARSIRKALSQRDGPITPIICEAGNPHLYQIERHVCIDTTASGGNTSLLVAAGDSV